MIQKKVSVIIPTKNRSGLLSRALESVHRQTYGNMEVIVVDDMSTDDTPSVIEKYRSLFADLKYIRNEHPAGGAQSRNLGIAKASGEYVAFLDDDDEWQPNKVESQADFLSKNPEFNVVSCWYLEDIAGKRSRVKKIAEISFKNMLWANFLGSFSFVMVRSDALKDVGFLDESLSNCHDWEYWIRVTKKFKASIIPDYLVVYYRHPGNISRLTAKKLSNYANVCSRNIGDMSVKCKAYHAGILVLSELNLEAVATKRMSLFYPTLKRYSDMFGLSPIYLFWNVLHLYISNIVLDARRKVADRLLRRGDLYVELEDLCRRIGRDVR